MKTDFECVGEFHETFGHPKYDTVQKTALVDNPKMVQFRIDLIQEEFNELKEGAKKFDLTEVVDALCDLKYVINGMGHVLGVNLDKAFQLVHESNMSKLCMNEKEAIESVEHYKTLPGFMDVRVGYRLAPDAKHYVIYNTVSGKILKSKYFHEPNFDELLA